MPLDRTSRGPWSGAMSPPGEAKAAATSRIGKSISSPPPADRDSATASAPQTPVSGSAIASAQNTGPGDGPPAAQPTRPPAAAASSPKATRSGTPRPYPVMLSQT